MRTNLAAIVETVAAVLGTAGLIALAMLVARACGGLSVP